MVSTISPSTGLADSWKEVVAGAKLLAASRYTICATTTLFVYDIVLTIVDEVELVWRRNLWTFPTLLYIGNRYVALASILLMCYEMLPLRPPLCKQGFGIVGFSVGVASWTGIMSLRVTALWRDNKFVVRLVWIVWGIVVAIMTTGALVVYASLLSTLQYNPITGSCTGIVTTHIQLALPVVHTIFVIFLTVLTVLRAYQYPTPLRSLKDVSTVANLLLRDGIVYFLVVLILSIASGISWLVLPVESSVNRLYLFVYLNWSIFSLIVTRLFLRLRKMFYNTYGGSGTPYTSLSPSNPGSGHHVDQFTDNASSRFFQDIEFSVVSHPETADRDSNHLALDDINLVRISYARNQKPTPDERERAQMFTRTLERDVPGCATSSMLGARGLAVSCDIDTNARPHTAPPAGRSDGVPVQFCTAKVAKRPRTSGEVA
ncbi:hypothetical protein CPB86DRAFT_692599 [Serendipita vermifera]|nr:hypothetical protein CPB86DRAFT_692599 [Serendipita vermifera]